MKQYFVKIADETLGPLSSNDVKRMAKIGQIQPDSLIGKGDGHWSIAQTVSGLEFPNAGNTQAVATKRCPACAESIKKHAKKCRYCGEILDRELAARSAANKTARGIAAVLAVILPGLGHMYRLWLFDALVWFFLIVTAYGFAFGSQAPVLFVLPLALHLTSIISAMRVER